MVELVRKLNYKFEILSKKRKKRMSHQSLPYERIKRND